MYRRHTNFSIEAIVQVFNGNPDFGRDASVMITRNGDLITNMYLMVRLSALNAGDEANKVAWSNWVGHALIREVELEIGGSRIDRHYGDWLNIWYELTIPAGQVRGYNIMVGNTKEATTLANTHNAYQLYVPMQFFHCRNDGLALPLISLQYHDVRVNFKFKAKNDCLVTTANVTAAAVTANLENAQLLVDYIYLDSEERKRFAQASHEYLIEQVQHTGAESVANNTEKFRLNYNHPTKFVVWALKLGRYTSANCFLAYNNNDWESARDLATKRFILNVAARTDATGTAEVTGGDYLFVHNGSGVDGILHKPAGLTGMANSIWEAITRTDTQLPRLIDDNDNKVRDDTVAGGPFMTLDNIIYADPIPVRHMSMPTSSVFVGVVSQLTNSEVDGDIDVCVNQFCNYGMHINHQWNPTTEAQIQLNGHDRFSARDGNYFNYVQPYQHFTNTPADGINVYSFALNPEDHQPSGAVNFSRIDNTQLNLKFGVPPGETLSFKNDYLDDDTKLLIFAVNYNVLRIMSGINWVYFKTQTCTEQLAAKISSVFANLDKQCKIQNLLKIHKPASSIKCCDNFKLTGTSLNFNYQIIV